MFETSDDVKSYKGPNIALVSQSAKALVCSLLLSPYLHLNWTTLAMRT